MQPFQPGQPMQPMQPIQPGRPTGVTILAILAIIGGAFGLCAGILGFVAAGAVNVSGTGVSTELLVIFSIVALALGVGELIFGIGALQLKPWAWTLGVGLEAVAIVFDIVEVALGVANIAGVILGIAIAGVVIYYLFQPQVQQAFGRVTAAR